MVVHTVNVNGLQLSYERAGAGPALLFLPGGNASILCFEAIVPHFLGDYTCFRLDHRGHGRSGRPVPTRYRLTDFIDDSEQLMDQVTGPAIVVGWSLGGLIAFGLSARRPDLVRGIFSENAVPHVGAQSADDVPVAAFLSQLGALARRREAEQLSVVEHAFNVGEMSTEGMKNFDLWPPALLLHFAQFTEGTDPAFYDAVGQQDLTEAEADDICSKVRCPVHIAVANHELGGVISPEVFQRFEATGIAFSSTDYPRSGHTLNFAFPREYINDLKAFLARVPAA